MTMIFNFHFFVFISMGGKECVQIGRQSVDHLLLSVRLTDVAPFIRFLVFFSHKFKLTLCTCKTKVEQKRLVSCDWTARKAFLSRPAIRPSILPSRTASTKWSALPHPPAESEFTVTIIQLMVFIKKVLGQFYFSKVEDLDIRGSLLDGGDICTKDFIAVDSCVPEGSARLCGNETGLSCKN